MRIVQAVPLVSDDGAFGGPISVAIAQSRALQRRGHNVLLVGGWAGDVAPPQTVEGVQATLFAVRRGPPGSGFSGLRTPGLQHWWARNSATTDIVHAHTGRHLITLLLGAAVRRSRMPLVVQTHGMLPPTRRPLGRICDLALTKPVLEAAYRVLALTADEGAELAGQFGSGVAIQRLINGVECQPDVPAAPQDKTAELLFLGRLHSRKRPVDLVRAAALLRDRGVSFRVSFVGPDEGERPLLLSEVQRLGLQGLVALEGPIPHSAALGRLSKASIFVLPSVDEPFPMALLEAMSVGTPSVTTTGCGIADLLIEYEAAGIVQPTPEALADELETLLANKSLRSNRVQNAKRLIVGRLSVDTVAQQLEEIYRQAM